MKEIDTEDMLQNEDEALKVKVATKKGYETVYPGGCFDAQYPNSKLRRSRVKDGGNISGALTCGAAPCYYEAKDGKRYLVRRLTEKECFRLMDVDDLYIDIIQAATITTKRGKVKQAVSKSQQLKLAGNSIVVSCLFHIFENMFVKDPPKAEPVQLSLFDYL